MSDVTVAADGGGAGAPASNEAVINESPTSQPSPIGSQAPDKPVGDIKGSEHRPESRRETIKRSMDEAFKRAENPPPKGLRPATAKPVPPADAKMGHNQPPEATEKLDLKKRPSDQPQRGERGRFVSQEDERRGEVRRDHFNAQANAQPVRKLPEGAPYRDPPPRMAEHAKRDWDTAPETVRGEFHRLAKEAGDMYRAYRPDHDVMNTIRPYHEMATQHGTTLARALNNYVTMEQKLRADPIGGLDIIVQNLNLVHNGQKIGLRDVAYAILNQTPDQQRILQNQNAQTAAQHQIGALHQQIRGLQNHLQQMHTAQQFTYTRSAVDQFADSHPRFDELGDLIEQELKTGYDLPTAYRRAELLRPTTHAAQTRNPSAQTRSADRSIYGAPDVTASNAASRSRPEKTPDRRAAIQNAIRSVGSAH